MYTITGNKTFWADDIEKSTTLYLSYRHQNYWDKIHKNNMVLR
ncbi:hypothetical protein PROPEN_01945 [Proteus penneri ATCC 35198]|nr:hypothetical protein PROPEN_01945 [Proteus penneri ATCC 35198]